MAEMEQNMQNHDFFSVLSHENSKIVALQLSEITGITDWELTTRRLRGDFFPHLAACDESVMLGVFSVSG